MNKNVTGIILIVLAALAVWWGWGKMKPYLDLNSAPAGEETTMTAPI